jgi:hypothetical protein
MIAQDQDVAITEIGKEACSFLGFSARAFIAVVGSSATSSRRGCDRLPASNIYAPYRNCVLPKSIRAVNPAGRSLDAAP